MSKPVIETVTFKLNAGVSRAEFAEAAREMNAWIESLEGFVHRRLSCSEEGLWHEHVQWENMDCAMAAAAGIGKEPANAKALAAIDGPSVTITHSELEVAIN